MDVDPLQDGPPARYAVESDSEDEIGFYPDQPRSTKAKRTYSVDVELEEGNDKDLVTLCGFPSVEGKILGRVEVDGVQVGEYILSSPATLVLGISHRLPLGAQYTVARAIVEKQQSSQSITIFDTYSYLGYISNQPLKTDDHPLRYLSTSSTSQAKIKQIQPYAPPNLIQHLSAAILAECEYVERPARVFLVPVREIAPPAPLSEPTLYNSRVELDLESVGKAVGVELRLDPAKAKRTGGWRRKSGDIGEGGMYI